MNAVVKKIQETLNKTVGNFRTKIVMIYIDTTYGDSGIEPFLNIIGASVSSGKNFDEAVKLAEENDDIGFIYDVLNNCEESFDEINLSAFFPKWPDDLKKGENEITDIIRHFISENDVFNDVQKLYFHHVDSLDFVKIIDKPQF
ncbi:MAG: hypothetical protein JW982_13985 [Spirochaetes bacterium]|nr:hypothetical protein [Spirochaetota bacterium]